MKKFLLCLGIALSLSGCNLFSGPSAVVKNLMSAAKKGDVEGMVSLWGSKATEEQGADKIRSNAQYFADFNRKVREAGEDPQVQNIRETIQGDRARVFFLYRDEKRKDSVGMGFALLKENGKWKLYRGIDVSEEEKPFDSSFAPPKSSMQDASPEPNPSPMEMISPPPAPSADSDKSKSNSNSFAESTNAPPISGGVLNAKATSLPKPAYPAAAKTVKASGTVVVSVTVDENGRVISASATSGHPLLRASAEAAARNARFNPTIIGGKYVKVTGTITYQFLPE
jgi:TonB family protein